MRAGGQSSPLLSHLLTDSVRSVFSGAAEIYCKQISTQAGIWNSDLIIDSEVGQTTRQSDVQSKRTTLAVSCQTWFEGLNPIC